MPDRASRVGVIGLGAMGLGTARALLDAGFAVFGCDVSPAACRALSESGGQVCDTPAELGAQVNIVITLVVNAAQVEAVLLGADGAVQNLTAGALVLQCSTVPPSFARRLEADLAEHGIRLLDAPVSGGTAKARDGDLSVMAAGTAAAFEQAAAVLAAVAAKVYRLGDRAGAGSTVKMINQLLAGVHIAAAAEAMALGIRAGVGPDTLYDVISHSAGNSWMFENRVPHILAGDYSPHSAVDIFVKDLGIVADTGRELTFPLPLSSTALQLFTMASAAGHGQEDDAAVVKVFASQTGIELPRTGVDDSSR